MTRPRNYWPHADRKRATLEDLRILIGRGRSVTAAALELDLPPRTAYRWLGQEPPS